MLLKMMGRESFGIVTIKMEMQILGSGGAMPTPRPLCFCDVCVKAREDSTYKRNSSSAYIEEIRTLIDCPEDIGDSLNREHIKNVDKLFITHWHPDHTFGLRVLLEAKFDFITRNAVGVIDVYLSEKTYLIMKKVFPSIDHYVDVKKTAKLHFIEDGDIFNFEEVKVEIVGYDSKNSDVYAFLFSDGVKKILYSSCDTISFKNYFKFTDLDYWVTECGIFTEVDSEISFDEMMKRIKEINPKKTILTHIEEIEVNNWGYTYMEELKEKYADIDFDYAFDGMKL